MNYDQVKNFLQDQLNQEEQIFKVEEKSVDNKDSDDILNYISLEINRLGGK